MQLHSSLQRLRKLLRLRRCLSALVMTLSGLLLLALVCGLLDAWQAYETESRTLLVSLALAAAAILMVVNFIRAWNVSLQQSAQEADRLLGEPRRTTTSALALKADEEESPLSRYLADKTREKAAEGISSLPRSKVLQWPSLLKTGRYLLPPLVVLAILFLALPQASKTILARLLQPGTDLPPWSPIQFSIEPREPQVVYGGELGLAVELAGVDALENPVELWVRDRKGGSIQKLTCYQESSMRYSKTLESMVEPVEVAFACGKARSKWHAVELLLQPRVLGGEATITPPGHTNLKPLTLSLDNDQLKIPEGSQVSLSLESNRPLSPCSMSYRLDNKPGEPEQVLEVEGKVTTENAVTFAWTATRSGTLEILIRDVQGTPASSPIRLRLDSVMDQPPSVELHSPGPYLYATPSSSIRISGFTEDEYGLSDVRLVRALQGFRDRALSIAADLEDKEFSFERQMNLAEVGIIPGEIIEVYVEAADHNPTLLGRNSSAISKVLIISEEQYAAYIRARTTLEEFNARYRALADALNEAARALEQLREALEQDDAEGAAQALENARKKHQQAAELLKRVAEDFPAFETEKRLQELARESLKDVEQNLESLEELDLADNDKKQGEAIDRMMERLGRQKQKRQEMERDAQLMAQTGILLEMAARFRKIYETQVSITKRIETIAIEIQRGINRNNRLLEPLADTQEKNREALDKFASDLTARLEQIERDELQDAKQSAIAFLKALEEADPQSVMELAAKDARNGNSNAAYVQAELARSLLEKLMDLPGEFPAACKGDSGGFKFDIPDVDDAMRQLLEGLLQQNKPEQGQGGQGGRQGMGQGQGQGLGAGGFGMGGQGQPGHSMLDAPVLGPERLRFQSEGSGSGTGQGKESGSTRPLDLTREDSDFDPGDEIEDSRHAPDPNSIPEAYREAVKRYYDQPTP